MQINTTIRAVLLGLLMLLAGITAAYAHASLLSTSPANNDVLASGPAEATLNFNEPVGVLSITLIGPDGSKTELTDKASGGDTVTVPLPQDLKQGTEALTWHIVSADGHPVAGTLIFSVGTVTGAGADTMAGTDRFVAIAIWICRVAIYLGLFGGVGALVFGAIAPLPNAVRRIAVALIGTGMVAAVLALGLQGVDGLGLTLAGLTDAKAWASGWGTSYGATIATVLAAFVVALLSMRLRIAAMLALVLTGLALALSGHASAADPQWLTRPAVFLHVTAICFWVGSLLPLAFLMLSPGEAAAQGLARFSAIIPYAVAPLVVSGAVLACVQLGWPGAAWFTPYAAILGAKLALLVVLFALAAVNRWTLTKPALAGSARARWRLGLSARAEIACVLVILGLVAGWRFTPPPRAIAQELAVPAEAHFHSEALMAELTVTPGRSGPVDTSLYLMDGAFGPVTPLSVTLDFSQQEAGIGPIEAKAKQGADGFWHTDGFVLPIGGAWTVTVEARTGKFELRKVSGEIEIR
jgi:copper transport protein